MLLKKKTLTRLTGRPSNLILQSSLLAILIMKANLVLRECRLATYQIMSLPKYRIN
jgi:hypothetical protein